MLKGYRVKRILLSGFAVAVTVGMLGSSACSATTFTRIVDVPMPEVSYEDGKATILIEGFPGFGDPGEPVLPIHAFSILLPSGEDVAYIEVESVETEEIILDSPLEWGQPQAPRGMDISWESAGSEAAIYDDDRPFPPRAAVHVTTQTYRGYNIAFFRVYPLRYVGQARRLLCSRSLAVTVETAPAPRMLARSAGTLRPHAERDMAGARELADELADVLFVLVCIANQTGVDLSAAIKDNLAKKTERDETRHWANPKLA